MSQIQARHLCKKFRVSRKRKGLRGALRGLVRPERRTVTAVDDVSFSIEQGEIVGYIGPNGAGKSTTVKMLCGILHPTSGEVLVEGVSPHRRREDVVRNMGVVFGQRTQLYWDLRLGESFELMRRIYRIDDETFERNLHRMTELLGIGDLLDVPVRQLSLGQRMRGDLVAAILHSPSILLLDEPTIGLDVRAKAAIREFVLEINRSHRTTVLLTTHDLGDVEKLCHRLIVIRRGEILEDAPLAELQESLSPYRWVIVDFEPTVGELSLPAHTEVVDRQGSRAILQLDRRLTTAAEVIGHLTRLHTIVDLQIREPDIEDVIGRYYEPEAGRESGTSSADSK